jgi:DNA excision repair protein ERCC-6
MLDIVEKAVEAGGIPFYRMDGSTPVGVRMRLVDDFNTNANISVFLLTTKVGGLGINLTGADRCVRMFFSPFSLSASVHVYPQSSCVKR